MCSLYVHICEAMRSVRMCKCMDVGPCVGVYTCALRQVSVCMCV